MVSALRLVQSDTVAGTNYTTVSDFAQRYANLFLETFEKVCPTVGTFVQFVADLGRRAPSVMRIEIFDCGYFCLRGVTIAKPILWSGFTLGVF